MCNTLLWSKKALFYDFFNLAYDDEQILQIFLTLITVISINVVKRLTCP